MMEVATFKGLLLTFALISILLSLPVLTSRQINVQEKEPLVKNEPLIFKLITFGRAGIGKTCLMKRLSGEDYNPLTTTMTLGMDINIMDLEAFGINAPFRVALYDTAGLEKHNDLPKNYSHHAGTL